LLLAAYAALLYRYTGQADVVIPRNANCVAFLPDRAERYLDTIYSDAWVETNLGDVSHLWEEAEASPVYA
jgi:hypothetical protein